MANMWEPEFYEPKEHPILFTKTGVVCSEPLNFFRILARRYDAERHSSDAIRLELSPAGTIDHSRNTSRRVHAELNRRTRNTLETGQSVVLDGFLNTLARRQQARQIAEDTGAVIVHIAFHTPRETIVERIQTRHADGRLEIPSSLVDPEELALLSLRMYRSLSFPDAITEPNVVHLTGTDPSRLLLRQIGSAVTAAEHRQATIVEI